MIDLSEIEKRFENIRNDPQSIVDQTESPAMMIIKRFYEQIDNLKKEGLSLSQVHKMVAPEINDKTFAGAYYRHQKKRKSEERKKKAAENKLKPKPEKTISTPLKEPIQSLQKPPITPPNRPPPINPKQNQTLQPDDET